MYFVSKLAWTRYVASEVRYRNAGNSAASRNVTTNSADNFGDPIFSYRSVEFAATLVYIQHVRTLSLFIASDGKPIRIGACQHKLRATISSAAR